MSFVFIVVTVISSILASMGVGGGGLFIILGIIFLSTDQKEMQFLNLIMFVSAGIIASISNIKSKSVFKKEIFQIVPFLIIGVFIGNMLLKKVGSEVLQKYFLWFMIGIGIYEIISSVIRIKNANNNSVNSKT